MIYKIGDKVKVKGYQGKGIIKTLDKNGNPEYVQLGDKIINVINEIVKLIGIVKPLIRLFLSLFKKK